MVVLAHNLTSKMKITAHVQKDLQILNEYAMIVLKLIIAMSAATQTSAINALKLSTLMKKETVCAMMIPTSLKRILVFVLHKQLSTTILAFLVI